MPSALHILNGNAVTLNGQVFVTDLAQSAANATTGLTVFNRTVNTGALSFSGRRLTFNGTVSSAGAVSITNAGLFLTAENADISVTNAGAAFTQNGAGDSQLAGGISTNGGAIGFATDLYLFGTPGDSMTFATGSATTAISVAGDAHIAAVNKTVTLASPLSARNAILYAGTLDFGDAAIRNGITTSQDLVLLGPAYDAADSLAGGSGIATLFAYNPTAPARTGTGTPHATLRTALTFPDGTAGFPASVWSGSFTQANLAGKTVAVGGNFYDNGVDLNASGAWTLSIPDNADATDSFAEAYNATIDNCTVTVNLAASPTGAFAWLAAAEGCADGGGNSGVDFARPTIVQAGTYTVYDNVIRVEASEAIENTNDEISAALANIRYWDGSALVAFTGSFTDRDCATTTDGAGDLAVFYLQTSADTWNTDATGISAGNAHRITSYNVCYTQLLRPGHLHLFHRHPYRPCP